MIISKTPLRMSFAGGGSDLKKYYKNHTGAVVSATIDKYVYISANKRFAEGIRVGYSQIEEVKNIAEIKHNLVREALNTVGVNGRTDICYMSDLLPANEGSGLGASSSLIVGTLNTLYAYTGKFASPKLLAEDACKIEIDILKSPIGKQDQYAAAYGGMNYIRFNSDEEVIVEPIIMSKTLKKELNRNLILFYTGVNTKSRDILTEQEAKTELNLNTISKMVGLADELRDSLRASDLTRFGEILHKGWSYKKGLASKITNSSIDTFYKKAMCSGALGGKILGSGGGGFLLFYCERKNQDNLRRALSNLREAKFNFEPLGSRIIYVDNDGSNFEKT